MTIRLSFFAVPVLALAALLIAFPLTMNAGDGSCIDENTGGFNDACDNGPEVVIISLWASPEVITQGQSSTLSLSVNFSGNGTCNTNIPVGSGIGANPETGFDEFVVYPSATTEYFYTCTTYTGQSGSDTATVSVNAAYADLSAGATSPSSATQGTPVTFSSTVSNSGNATATNFPNSFQISGVGYVAAQTHTLGAGGSTGISANYTFGAGGTYQVRACADTNTSGNGAYSEPNEDNCGGWTSVVVAPLLADIAASQLQIIQITGGLGALLQAVISNTGSGATNQ